MNKYMILFSVVTISCGTGEPFSPVSANNISDSGEAGEENSAGNGVIDNGGQSSSGGSKSDGGKAGMNISGTYNGGSSSSGNNNGGASVAGSYSGSDMGGSNSAGSSSCTPKTCDDMSVVLSGKFGLACGVFPDNGCGNVLNCPDECTNSEYLCGKSAPEFNEVDNICGGGCTALGVGPVPCPDDIRVLKVYKCLVASETVPSSIVNKSCILPSDFTGTKTNYWCCQ